MGDQAGGDKRVDGVLVIGAMRIDVIIGLIFAFSPLRAQTVRSISVSQTHPFTDHITQETDATDKDVMVKFVFDEAANQLTVSLISHRMIFVFRDDVRFRPLIKGRRIRPDLLPYVVSYDPSERFMISKLFKSTVPKPRKQYVFHRWIDCEGMQPAPQEYAMVNDYISQTFDIHGKRREVIVRLRDVMLMNDISKHQDKRRYEIPYGRDLAMEYHVEIERDPCFGLDEDIASARTALDGVRKGYDNMRKRFGTGTVADEATLEVFHDLKDVLQKQYPRKEGYSSCPDIQEANEAYNAYADSIAAMKCRVVAVVQNEGRVGDGVSASMLLAKARQIDASVSRWLLSVDPVERRDIIQQVENVIKTVNSAVATQGVRDAEQREALSVFRDAEHYYHVQVKK